MLGEFAAELPGEVVLAVAVNPAVDLQACYRSLARRRNRFYDRYFVRKLWQQIVARPKLRLPAGLQGRTRPPTDLRDLEDRYTRVVWGFGSLDEHCTRSSAVPWLRRIRVPSLVVAADDDPIVPRQVFDALPSTPSVRVHLTRGGGHLGFVGRGGVDPDHRWVEWRVVDWTLAAPASDTLTKAA
jgi:predicted alpha/beta-fold hydrolase